MAGPVWRFESSRKGSCSSCFRQVAGMYIEGEVEDNQLLPCRGVCHECYQHSPALVVGGQSGARVVAPAYARRP